MATLPKAVQEQRALVDEAFRAFETVNQASKVNYNSEGQPVTENIDEMFEAMNHLVRVCVRAAEVVGPHKDPELDWVVPATEGYLRHFGQRDMEAGVTYLLRPENQENQRYLFRTATQQEHPVS